jgi:hypothetical protein
VEVLPTVEELPTKDSTLFVRIVLALLMGAGTLIRFHGVALRPMCDEAASWTFARLPWHSFLKARWDYEGNMLFYYLILRLWVHLGDSEVILRSLSIFFGVATIPIVYRLGALFSRSAGLIAATLVTQPIPSREEIQTATSPYPRVWLI